MLGRWIAIMPLMMIFLLVGAGSASAATNINNCSVLNTAGETYVLTQDIINSPNTTCITAQANNLILDCGGHRIDGTDSAGSRGIYSNSYNNLTIRNCNITDWGNGIYLTFSSYNTIYNDSIDSDQTNGIYTSSSNSNLIDRVNVSSSQNHGLYITGSSNNNITDSEFNYDVSYGIFMDSSSNNNIVNNSVFRGNELNGMGVQYSSGNMIINTRILSNSINGILIHYSSNNNVTNCSLYSNGNQGVRVTYSSDNWIKDSVIESSGNEEIYTNHDSASANYFVNCTFNKSDVSVNGQATIWVKWYLSLVVSDLDSQPVASASLNVTDANGALRFSNTTNSSGYIPMQTLDEYNQTASGKTYFTPYAVNAKKSGYLPNSTNLNLTASINFIVYLEEIKPPTVQLKTYDIGLSEKETFKPGRVVRIRAFVNTSLGRDYLSNATVLMIDNLGSTMVNNALMTNVSAIDNGYVYEYNYTTPSSADGLWQINVTAANIYDMKGYDWKKIAITTLTIQVKLVLNSTSDVVYIPSSGLGERAFSELSTNKYYTPEHYYIASYSGDALKAVVSSSLNPLSLITEKGSSIFSIGTEQRFANSMVFIVFSRGSWITVNNRLDPIERGEFLTYSEPSFGFGLGTTAKLKILLQYQNIDLNKTGKIGKGYNMLVIENTGKLGGKSSLEIGRP